MTELLFTDLGLAEPVQRAVQARNHITPTPIQAQAIPKLLKGRDMLGIAQTGTGKTAAFVLPILSRMAHNPPPKRGRRHIRSLILAPTRELAIQIGDDVQAYAKTQRLFQAVIFGGVSQKPQAEKLKRGVDFVIATPGRLLDLMSQGYLDFSHLDTVVFDEADRMLDMGFVHDVRKIIKVLPERRQSLLFSATMPDAIARLSREFLTDPVRVEVTPPSTPLDRIVQTVHHVEKSMKQKLLVEILADATLAKVIIFTRMKHRANRVAEFLKKAGISAAAIHGNKSQGARQHALKAFKDGGIRVLVATDIAARGIDIDGITHVINFELPNEPESYVHRIGRTGRAGASGAAVAFCDASERAYLMNIEKLTGVRLTAVGNGVVDMPARGREAGGFPIRPSGAPQKKRRRRRGGQNNTRREVRASDKGNFGQVTAVS